MIRQIISIVIRNRDNADGMTVELLNLLSHHSTIAKQLTFYRKLDTDLERVEMIAKKNDVTIRWRSW